MEIGAGAVIVGGVTVGDGAKIGPNTVVFKDVPAGGKVFVTPPRMIVPSEASAETDAPTPSGVGAS